MSESDEYILKRIEHYQQSLDKYTPLRNESKLLHCIGKLHKLPIKVSHLKETGIGRTVNALRKVGGLVGDASKSLVAKWKEIVVEEDAPLREYESKEKKHKHSSSHKESDKEKVVEKSKTSSSSNSKYGSSNHGSHSSKSDRNEKQNKESDRHNAGKHKRRYDSGSDSGRSSNSDESEDEQPAKKQIKLDDHQSKSQHKSSGSKLNSSKKNSRPTESDLSDEDDSDLDTKSLYKNKKSTRDSSSENEEIKAKHSKNEHKSSKNSHNSSSSSNSSHKHKDKYADKNNRSCEKEEKQSSSKSDSRKDNVKKHSSEKHEKKPSKTEDHNSKSERKDKSKRTTEKSTKSSKPKVNYEFDMFSQMGAQESFEDGGESSKSAKSATKKKPSSSKDNHAEKSSSSNCHSESRNSEDKVPSLLKEPKLEPLDINISSLLPTITPNYRPLGNFPVDSPLKRALTEEEALSRSISSKNQRTKVYSGNKVAWGKVPSLFEICIRILQDNIDALEYTGGVPYSILKPVLDKATPKQLFVLEHHNPHLIEDSDELWQLHCQKDFRNKHRQEMETWREMYMRCLDERDAKLKALTENIKIAQEKCTPVRVTKLAYVEDYVKPPRNIARKQAKNGTAFDKKPSVTPSSRLSALATAGEAGKVAVPNPGARAVERSNASHALKPKKAPLMAKTLSLFKNRFRR